MPGFYSEKGGTVLLIEDDASRRFLLEQAFTTSGLGLDQVSATSAAEALTILGSARPDLIIAARGLADISGTDLIPLMHALHADLPVFIMETQPASLQRAGETDEAGMLEAMRAGAADFFTYAPLDLAKLPYLALRAVEDSRARRRLDEMTSSTSPEAVRAAVDRQAARQRGKDLAAIAHDLRSPLAGLMALLDMLQSGGERTLPPAVRERVVRIRAASDQIASLASQISDLALVEAGKLDLSSHPVDIEEMLQAAMRHLDAKLRSRAATLKLTVPPGLPRLQGDPLRLSQLLTSLIAGLLKLAEGTALELVVAPRGAMVELTLREEPFRGIPVEALPPGFAQDERSWPEPRVAGEDLNGLSLSIARGLVRLHGGTLLLPGDLERGTLAILTLPAEPAEPKHRADKLQDLLRPQP